MDKKIEINFSKQEIEKATNQYFNGDELATDVWIKKYCLKDESKFYELTPDDMHRRIAREIARIEAKYLNPRSEDEIYETLKNFKRIIPQGSPMSGIGNNFQVVSLSNCFVIGDETSDSYGGIFKIDQEQVQLMKRRGGVGHDLSHIRPNGSPVKNSAITSTGIVPFMERYSNSTKEVAQDGRRGALMLSVSIKHPDAEQFIDAKLIENKITGANISIKIDDEFMCAVENNVNYIQSYPLDLYEKILNDKNGITYLFSIQDFLKSGELNKIEPIKNFDEKIVGYLKKIDANKLWKKIVYNAWKSAEPGVLFWDKVISESIPDCYQDNGFKTVSTNPCFPSSERLLTKNGYFKFGDLVSINTLKTNDIVCDKRISYINDGVEKPENWIINNNETGTIIRKASNVFLSQVDAEILEIKSSKGFKLKCTPDHHIATTNGMIEAKDLTTNDNILISIPDNEGCIINKEPESVLEMLSILFGLIQGDGTLDKKRKRLHFDFWGNDIDRMKNMVCNIIDKLYNELGERRNSNNEKLSKYFYSNKKNKLRITSAWVGKIFEEYGFNFQNKFIVPEFVFNNSSNNIGKFYVAALMYCDGSLQGTEKSGYTIRLSQSNEDFLNQIQIILHSNGLIFGIYKRRDKKLTLMPNGSGGSSEYKTKTQFELISLGGSIVKYISSIGFLGDLNKEQKFNKNHNYNIKKSFTDTIVSISKLDNEHVFCLKEDVGRNIIVNGISARRCGEIPLCPYDSCRLLAINLYGYVVNPFTSNAYFDWDLFKSDSQIAMRYMDDIIDLEIEKIDTILSKIHSDPENEFVKLYEINLWERIKEMTINGRRTGLGITAEGDMLASLNLIYGTDAATDFSESIHKELKLSAYRSSVILAKERGAFPIYNSENEINNPFILRIKNEDLELYNDMVKYGRRNIALLTIAPTGTASLMTQTSSGIENCFLTAYNRRRKINPQEKDVRIDFIDDEGITWMEYPVFHHHFETWLKANDYDVNVVKTMNKEQVDEIIKKSPYYKATSADVDWVKKVEMQGRIQQHIDHSISTTINLPNDVTEETVANVYKTGWRSGCKGITVYRDGSRSGVLVGIKEKKCEFHENHAPKRPKRLKGEIHRFQNNLEKWIAVVGIKDERPYEIFTGKFENGLSNLPSNVKDCEVVKNIIEVDGINEVGEPIKLRKKRYDIEYVDSDGVKQTHVGLNHAFNPEYWNYAKLFSGVLRHGMPIIYVYELIDSLNLNTDNLNTWKNGVARVVKKYIKDGEKSKGTCQVCGSTNFEFKEGCLMCTQCGWSKCS